MQVIGLCRFSYPAIGGFQIEHEDIQQRIDYLYGAARLEERFRLFETITLPALRRQTDPDFDFIILIGDSLPQRHRARLEALTVDIPQVQIIAQSPQRHRVLMNDLLLAARHAPSAPCLQFRLDDDDAVAVDFVEALRNTAHAAQPFLEQHKTAAIDFCNGYLASVDASGLRVAEHLKPYVSAALALYIRGGVKQSVMSFGHHKVYEKMPTLTLNTPASFVRTHNGFNDARQGQHVKQIKLHPATPQELRTFEAAFNIRADHITSVFSQP